MSSVLPKKLIIFLISVFLFSNSFSTTVLASHSTSTPDSSDNKTIQLINAERQKANLGALRYVNKLYQAAAKHNDLMSTCSLTFGTNACFTHQVTQLGEPDLMTRINQTGYGANSVAENIAWGQTTPESAMSSWMASSGHRENILTTSRVDVGCDYLNSSGRWWTCVFAKSPNSQTTTPLPTATPTPRPTATPTLRPTPTPSPRLSPTPIPTIISVSTPVPAITAAPTNPWWCSIVYIAGYCS